MMFDVIGMRRWCWLTLALATTLAVGACTNGSSDASPERPRSTVSAQLAAPGKPVSNEHIAHLKVGLIGDSPSLDVTVRSQGSLYITPLGLESLLRVSPDGKLEPWLAAKWEQQSDTVYSYTLRKGIKFWDGSELTSADVKYSWEHARRPESTRATYFDSVATFETPDKYTIEVRLKYPDASWEFTPAMFYSSIFEKKFAEAHEQTLGQPGTLMVGTGPWKFDNLDSTSGAELSANADYWGGKPPIDRISFKLFSDPNSMALALRAGEINLAPVVASPKTFDTAAGGGTITNVPTCATAHLSMPTQTAPWDDVHVRRAVSYALNRKAIVAATQGNGVSPAYTMLSPILLRSLATEDDVKAALDSVPTYKYDIEKAKAELAKSKVPNGFSGTIRTKTVLPNRDVTQVIAQELKKIGINLKVESSDDAKWYTDISGPADNRPLTFGETSFCTPDPNWTLDLWLGRDSLVEGGLNAANYAPADVDQILEHGVTAQNPADRLEIYTALLKRLAKDVPYAPLYSEGTAYASKKYDIAGYSSFWYSMPWALNVISR